MKVYLASDHSGFALKSSLTTYFNELGYEVEDMGALTLDPEDDYPDYVRPAAECVAATEESMGIVIGSSGQGEAMVANRVSGVRCAVFYGTKQAPASFENEGTPGTDGYDIVRVARLHNDANMLSLAARFLSDEEAKKAIEVFFTTQFSGGERHVRRIRKF
jgi:ribose 5-phosphate isomerase B